MVFISLAYGDNIKILLFTIIWRKKDKNQNILSCKPLKIDVLQYSSSGTVPKAFNLAFFENSTFCKIKHRPNSISDLLFLW